MANYFVPWSKCTRKWIFSTTRITHYSNKQRPTLSPKRYLLLVCISGNLFCFTNLVYLVDFAVASANRIRYLIQIPAFINIKSYVEYIFSNLPFRFVRSVIKISNTFQQLDCGQNRMWANQSKYVRWKENRRMINIYCLICFSIAPATGLFDLWELLWAQPRINWFS